MERKTTVLIFQATKKTNKKAKPHKKNLEDGSERETLREKLNLF